MSLISEKNKKSGVKILIKTLIVFSSLCPQFTFSATQSEIAAKRVECANLRNSLLQPGVPDAARGSADSCAAELNAMLNEVKDEQNRCKTAQEAVRKANLELSNKCGEASLGDDCVEEANNCAEASGEDSYNSIGTFAEAAGYGQYSTVLNTAFKGNKKTENGVCAKYSSKDYETKKDSLTKDLEKVADDLAKLTKDKAKLQKDFAEDLKNIQKGVDEAQEELDKQKLKIKDSKRERLANFQNDQNRQKEALRQKNMSILDIKGKIISSERDKAMKLVALTDAAGKRTCMTEYNKARASYQKTSSSSTSNFVASSSAKKNDLVAIYTDCMAIFQQQRVALNESKKQEIDALNAQLANLQSEVDELSGTMELASNQLAEMEQDATTEQSQAEQKVIKKMQTAQQEMLTAQQDLNSNLQALAQEESNLKTKQNRLNNSLMTMGPAPLDGAKATPRSIAKAAGTLAENVQDLEKERDEICPSKTTSKPKPNSRPSGDRQLR